MTWVLHSDPRDTAYLEFDESADGVFGPAPRCDSCGRFTGPRTWLPPFRVSLRGAGTVWPAIAFGTGLDLLVTQEAVHEWGLRRQSGGTVLGDATVVRTKWRGKMPSAAPHLVVIRPTESRDAIDAVASGMRRGLGIECAVCRSGGTLLGFDRIVLEEPRANPALDLFIARGLPGVVLCSDRLAERIRASAQPGVTLTPAALFRWQS